MNLFSSALSDRKWVKIWKQNSPIQWNWLNSRHDPQIEFAKEKHQKIFQITWVIKSKKQYHVKQYSFFIGISRFTKQLSFHWKYYWLLQRNINNAVRGFLNTDCEYVLQWNVSEMKIYEIYQTAIDRRNNIKRDFKILP